MEIPKYLDITEVEIKISRCMTNRETTIYNPEIDAFPNVEHDMSEESPVMSCDKQLAFLDCYIHCMIDIGSRIPAATAFAAMA